MVEKLNPFAVQTPESIPARDALQLFVDVFSDFQHIPNPGHTFIHGPRGSGKTMMFRILEPDCQLLHSGRPLSEQPFFGVYVPIKNTTLGLTELIRLRDSQADQVLSEHSLAISVVARFLSSLQKTHIDDAGIAASLHKFYCTEFTDLIRTCGMPGEVPELSRGSSVDDCLHAMQHVITQMHGEAVQFLRRLSFDAGHVEYTGALTGFLDFVVPILRSIRHLAALSSGPIFLLMDDADNLSETQTRVLNSWVATRTSADISIKISTQLAYKTYRTTSGTRIASPHDFSEVNISGVYTSRKSKYQERMRQIVSKRLIAYRLPDDPDLFFPPKTDQETAINAISEQYRMPVSGEPRGYHARDDANRYARPDYIRKLSQHRGGRANYSYAGFAQLVHISSGVVRHFLDAAARMYADDESRLGMGSIEYIEPATQDRVVRELADQLFRHEFDVIVADEAATDVTREMFKKLRSLIEALGNAFHEILISEASERRVFSVALSDGGDADVVDILRLGVRFGYFHESTIGAKVGIGRVPLFILTRRLAPFFTLDPTSFAGYQFVTSETLRAAMTQPRTFIRRLKAKPGMESLLDDPQMRLPLESD